MSPALASSCGNASNLTSLSPPRPLSDRDKVLVVEDEDQNGIITLLLLDTKQQQLEQQHLYKQQLEQQQQQQQPLEMLQQLLEGHQMPHQQSCQFQQQQQDQVQQQHLGKADPCCVLYHHFVIDAGEAFPSPPLSLLAFGGGDLALMVMAAEGGGDRIKAKVEKEEEEGRYSIEIPEERVKKDEEGERTGASMVLIQCNYVFRKHCINVLHQRPFLKQRNAKQWIFGHRSPLNQATKFVILT